MAAQDYVVSVSLARAGKKSLSASSTWPTLRLWSTGSGPGLDCEGGKAESCRRIMEGQRWDTGLGRLEHENSMSSAEKTWDEGAQGGRSSKLRSGFWTQIRSRSLCCDSGRGRRYLLLNMRVEFEARRGIEFCELTRPGLWSRVKFGPVAFQIVRVKSQKKAQGWLGLEAKMSGSSPRYVYGWLGLSRVAPDRDIQEWFGPAFGRWYQEGGISFQILGFGIFDESDGGRSNWKAGTVGM